MTRESPLRECLDWIQKQTNRIELDWSNFTTHYYEIREQFFAEFMGWA